MAGSQHGRTTQRRFLLSSNNVTGPSLTSDTCIIA